VRILGDRLMRGGGVTCVDETLQRVIYAVQSERFNEAVRLAQLVLDQSPNHPKGLHLYGFALLMEGRAEEALKPLEKAFRSLRDPAIETQFAVALRKAGRIDDAINRLARIVKRQPPFPAAIHEYGYVLHSLKRSDEAIAVLKVGIEAAPWMPELPLLMGWIFHSLNDGVQAKAAFALALGINPDHPDALYGMGLVSIDAGDFARAAEYFRRALLSDPSDQQSRLHLGACFLELGQTGAASACLRQTTRGHPDYYGKVLKVLSSSSRGRFWLQPSAARKFFIGERN